MGGESPILIKYRDGRISSLDEESPITTALPQVNRLYVFAPKDYDRKVGRAAEEVFEIPNAFIFKS